MIPQKFELQQNYPNPFNSSTKIRFGLPKRAAVKITIYDLLGRIVITLIEQTLSKGWHVVNWNGENTYGKQVAAGLYFYKFETKQFSAIRKMIYNK